MSRCIAPIVSDLHVNSTLGLCPPQGILQDDGGLFAPNRLQRWLIQCWKDFLNEVSSIIRPDDEVYGIVAGDTPDKNPKTTQLMTFNDESIVRAAVEVLEPLRDLCTDGFWMLRGTETHIGQSGHLEEAVARSLKATKYPIHSETYSSWILRVEFGGVKIDCTHHGPIGRLPWTTMNGLGRVCYEIIDEYVASNEPYPDIALQGHNHRYADTGSNYPIRVISLPCFQLSTSYGARVSPRRRTHIGACILIIEDGRCNVKPVLFRPDMEKRWTKE